MILDFAKFVIVYNLSFLFIFIIQYRLVLINWFNYIIIILKYQSLYLLPINLLEVHWVIYTILELWYDFIQVYHIVFGILIVNNGIYLGVIISQYVLDPPGLDTFLSFILAVFFIFPLFQGLIDLQVLFNQDFILVMHFLFLVDNFVFEVI